MESRDSQIKRTQVGARMVEYEGGIQRELPPGYRFMPKDHELMNYLTKKANLEAYQFQEIEEVSADHFIMRSPHALVLDIYLKTWHSQEVVFTDNHEREWYFFIHDDQDLIPFEQKIIIVGHGMGFWRCYSGEYPMYKQDEDGDERVIGYKIEFIYYKGELSKPIRTDWKMNLYRLPTEYHNPAQGRKWTLGKIVRGNHI